MEILKLATVTIALVLSTSVNAATISTDWQSTGDNLITVDTVSGLEWLDVTETFAMTYNEVTAQLGANGTYDGFRYATTDEVIALWENFNIDMSPGGTRNEVPGIDPNVATIASFLGDTFLLQYPSGFATGVFGLTGTNAPYPDMKNMLGVMAVIPNDYTTYYPAGSANQNIDRTSFGQGSYLVKASVVPVPAAVWLFGSGLVGLIGVARRKKV